VSDQRTSRTARTQQDEHAVRRADISRPRGSDGSPGVGSWKANGTEAPDPTWSPPSSIQQSMPVPNGPTTTSSPTSSPDRRPQPSRSQRHAFSPSTVSALSVSPPTLNAALTRPTPCELVHAGTRHRRIRSIDARPTAAGSASSAPNSERDPPSGPPLVAARSAGETSLAITPPC